jgi:hypothetical protein
MKNFFVIVFLTILGSSVYGQEGKVVYFHLDKITLKEKSSTDSLLQIYSRENALTSFMLNGYVGVFPTDTIAKKNTIHYYFDYTHLFKKIILIPEGKKEKHISSEKNLYRGASELNSQLNDLENNGYPFAQLKIVNQVEKGDRLELTYKIDSGAFYTIEKIHLKSQTDFHTKTVMNIIGIKAGDTYDESKIRAISTILLNSSIFYSPRAPELIFRADKAELYVYFEKKKSSNADGFIGFQQDQFTNQLTLNGYLNIELKNALNRAETIHLNWKNNPDKTQNLRTIIEYPYLFSSPFGIGTEIDLQKQDTSFVRSDLLFELAYRNPQFKISIFDQIEASNTLSSIPIPGFRDFSKNTIGATVQYRPFLANRFSFYHPQFTISGGVFNYRADTLSDNTRKIANHKYRFKYEHRIDFLRFFHLNNSIQLQGLASSVGLARNEYIYFGGLQSVRGFYELELAGRENWILRNEIEFQPVALLSLKLIYDYSNFRNEIHNYTHSIGFGFALINNDSQLEIIVANGKLNDNPFSVSGSKVHIGFRSNF